MVGLLLISAAVLGVLARATAGDLAVELTPAKYEEHKKNLEKLGECLEHERTSSGHLVASANIAQHEQKCATGTDLQWSLWPKPELNMCYRLQNQKLGEFGDKYTFTDETDVGAERGAWFTAAKKHSNCIKSKHCEAGFEAKFQTKFEIVPVIEAHASMESIFTPHKAKIELDLDIDTTVTTGISVLAEGSCSYTETKYFPRVPQPVARFCYGPACAVVFFQGMMELNIEGRLEAGATAVHQVQFGASGKFELNTNTHKLTENNIKIAPPRSAYRTKTYFDVHGKVSLKLGPVFTVMFTPGVGSLWASAIPWIQVEASMYGAMRHTRDYASDTDMTISDALFDAHTVSQIQCPASTTTAPPTTTTTAPITTTCFNAAIALRTGIEFDAGFLPKSLGATKDEVKQTIKESICKIAALPAGLGTAAQHAAPSRSVFEDGFMALMEASTSGGRRRLAQGVSQCVLDNTPTNGRRLGTGSASVSAAIDYWCGSMVDWLFFGLPAKSLFTFQHHSQSCRDVKLFPSNECSHKVGCHAEAPGPVLVRAQGGQEVEDGTAFVPEVRSNGRYYPICGHRFWDDNGGAESVCNSLGFTHAKLLATKDVYSTDAMPVGRCHGGESLNQCTAGGNAFGDPEYNGGQCNKGQPVGVKVVCMNFAAVRARDYYPSMPPAGTAFVPEVFYNGRYYPICGHHFWDDNGGAESVCNSLGFFSGGKVQVTKDAYSTDAMPVGRCHGEESLDQCTAGGNAFGNLGKTYGLWGNDNCRKGQKIGVKVVCEAYNPCKNAAEGSACRVCPPGLTDCFETTVLKTCQQGECRPGGSVQFPFIKTNTRNLRQRLSDSS